MAGMPQPQAFQQPGGQPPQPIAARPLPPPPQDYRPPQMAQGDPREMLRRLAMQRLLGGRS